MDLVSNGRAHILTPRSHFGNVANLAVAPDGAAYIVGDGSLYRIDRHRYSTLFNPFEHLPDRLAIFAGSAGLAVSQSGAFYISFTVNTVPAAAGIVELSRTGWIIHLALTGKIAR